MQLPETRPVVPVRETPWLTVGIAAMGAKVAILLAASAYVVRFVLGLLQDDLLFLLAVVFLPIVLIGVSLTLGAIRWMVGIIRKLLACDGSARVDLAVAGVGGLAVGLWLTLTVQSPLAAVLVVPSAAALAVALSPAAWPRAGSEATSA